MSSIAEMDIYLECGDGWLSLLGDLHTNLLQLSPTYKIAQVKEKFGTLRYYVSDYGTDSLDIIDQMNILIEEAQDKSQTICENCGSSRAHLSFRGFWLKTLCSDCQQRLGYEKKEEI